MFRSGDRWGNLVKSKSPKPENLPTMGEEKGYNVMTARGRSGGVGPRACPQPSRHSPSYRHSLRHSRANPQAADLPHTGLPKFLR